MRVVFGHHRFVSQNHGGISRYFLELASALARTRACQVEFYAPFHVNSALEESRLAGKHSVRLPKFPASKFVLGPINSLLGASHLRPRHDVDIFHETYYSRVSLAPKFTPTVLTVFDMIHERFPASFSRLDFTSIAKRSAVNRADHVVCISESTQRDLVEILGVPKSRTSVVHLASSMTIRAPRLQAPSTRPYILFVGARDGYKNFRSLLKAFAASPLLKRSQRIVCFGGGRFRLEELRAIKECGLAEHVVHASGDDGELERAYSLATMLVYPSLYEGFGLPIVEAMSVGCPVACSNTSSMPEVAGGAALLFNPTACDEIRESIESLAASPGLRSRMVALGHERARHFSWERCAEATFDVYKSLLRN